MSEVIKLNKYPESVEELAAKMDLPMEDMEARKAAVKMFINTVSGL